MIVIYKNQGETLGQLTKKVKEKLNKKICYIGRLDPIASGLICFLLDEECKLASKYLHFDKTYCFNLILGISTDTSDPLGMITGLSPVFEVDYSFIDLFNDFSYIQKYPIYSSFEIRKENIKKPLWYFAKNGIKLDEEDIPNHRVHIKALEKVDESFYIKTTDYFIRQIDKLDENKGKEFRKNEIKRQYEELKEIHLYGIPMIAKVSSGTYIRKLCEDIGKYLGVPAMADGIERVAFHFPDDIKNYEFL